MRCAQFHAGYYKNITHAVYCVIFHTKFSKYLLSLLSSMVAVAPIQRVLLSLQIYFSM